MDNIQNKKIKKFFIYNKNDSDTVIIFLHGFGGMPEDLNIFLKFLSIKGNSIASPYFPGYKRGDNYQKKFLKVGPKEWIEESKKLINELSADFKNIFLIGFSFGGNIALELASMDFKNIKGVVVLEVPIFFTKKINLALYIIQPLLRFFHIKSIKPSRIIYRKGYKKSGVKDGRLPIIAIGKIFKFIKKNTRKNLSKITKPILIMQAEKSDLITKKSSKYIYYKIKTPPDKKELFYLKVDNHDLNLMDEEGKILMMEKINNFINKIKKEA